MVTFTGTTSMPSPGSTARAFRPQAGSSRNMGRMRRPSPSASSWIATMTVATTATGTAKVRAWVSARRGAAARSATRCHQCGFSIPARCPRKMGIPIRAQVPRNMSNPAVCMDTDTPSSSSPPPKAVMRVTITAKIATARPEIPDHRNAPSGPLLPHFPLPQRRCTRSEARKAVPAITTVISRGMPRQLAEMLPRKPRARSMSYEPKLASATSWKGMPSTPRIPRKPGPPVPLGVEGPPRGSVTPPPTSGSPAVTTANTNEMITTMAAPRAARYARAPAAKVGSGLPIPSRRRVGASCAAPVPTSRVADAPDSPGVLGPGLVGPGPADEAHGAGPAEGADGAGAGAGAGEP